MHPREINAFREHLGSLTERELWQLLVDYFVEDRQTHATIVNSPSEHGMDVVARVEPRDDFLGQGYYILIQAKTGNLTMGAWRKALYQLLEVPCFPIPATGYDDPDRPRRILLVVTGTITPEAHRSVRQFNRHHRVPVRALDLNELALLRGFQEYVLQRLGITLAVGEPSISPEEFAVPPVVDEVQLEFCDECDPGEDRPRGVISWRVGYFEGDVEPTGAIGYCDWCNSLHVRCPNCGEVRAILEGSYGEPVECWGACGTRFLVEYEHPRKELLEERVTCIHPDGRHDDEFAGEM